MNDDAAESYKAITVKYYFYMTIRHKIEKFVLKDTQAPKIRLCLIKWSQAATASLMVCTYKRKKQSRSTVAGTDKKKIFC